MFCRNLHLRSTNLGKSANIFRRSLLTCYTNLLWFPIKKWPKKSPKNGPNEPRKSRCESEFHHFPSTGSAQSISVEVKRPKSRRRRNVMHNVGSSNQATTSLKRLYMNCLNVHTASSQNCPRNPPIMCLKNRPNSKMSIELPPCCGSLLFLLLGLFLGFPLRELGQWTPPPQKPVLPSQLQSSSKPPAGNGGGLKL